MSHRPDARSGMALILTLAAIVLAGGLALYLQARAVELSRSERVALDQAQLQIAVSEAAREMLLTLASDEDLKVDHLGEDWAIPRETTRENGISTWARVEDAGRYFNWNNLGVSNRSSRTSAEILLDLMTFCGDFSPVVRVEALTDFLDPDEDGSYESGFYQAEDLPYDPPNRELWAPSELLWVHDFSADLFRPRPKADLDDLFGGDLSASTVLVPARIKEPIPINVNTASRDVLMAVTGLQQDAAVRTVLALREVQPFESLTMMFMASPELAAALEGTLGTGSTFFRVKARASKADLHRSVMAWVKRDERGDIQILQWIDQGS
jgi:general secretion pathway protein K